MPLGENIQLALASLRAGKMRALLTMLGIIIGIGAVITIVTIGDSMAASIRAEMASFGARNVTVEVRQKDEPGYFDSADAEVLGGDGGDGGTFEYREPAESDLITPQMLAEYRRVFAGQLAAAAARDELGSVSVQNGRHKAGATLVGCNADQAKVAGLALQAGRFITDGDGEDGRAVAAVSDLFIQQYFGGRLTADEALGESFSAEVEGRTLHLYIVGVYRYQPPDGAAPQPHDGTTNTEVYLPIHTGKKLLQRPVGYRSLTLQSQNQADSRLFLQRTQTFFMSYYTRNPYFTAKASSMESMMNSMDKMTQNVKLGISAIAAISLLVGGIGVMNIMMVSVTERTREIGVRMALGARCRTILWQFIVEAVIICLIGGMIGAAVGIGLGSAGATMMGYPARPSLAAMAVAVVFSMAIGIFFGYYPAKKAARMDPIDALRYE